jgi:hypothetical protein
MRWEVHVADVREQRKVYRVSGRKTRKRVLGFLGFLDS